MKNFLCSFLLFFLGCNTAASSENKYADAILESNRQWLHVNKIFTLTLVSAEFLHRKNIDLYNETIQCYDKITVDSEKDTVIKCFVYDFLAYYLVVNGLQVEGIKNYTEGVTGRASGGGGRFYKALLKIGVPEEEVKMTLGGYYIVGFSAVPTFIELRKENPEKPLRLKKRSKP